MKILFVSGSLPDVKCGVGKYTSLLLRTLLKEPDVELAVLTVHNRRIKSILGVNHFNSRGNTITESDMRLAIKSFKPDIIHFQFPTVGLIEDSTLHEASRVGIAIVQTWHEHFNECNVLNIDHAKNMDGLVYVRENLLDKLPNEIAILLARVDTKYIQNTSMLEVEVIDDKNSILDISRILERRKPRINLFYFGFIQRNKGLLELILDLDFSKYNLFISGEIDPQNEYTQELMETIESHKLTKLVTLCGYLNDSEIRCFTELADAIVFPFQEGVGAFNTSYLAALNSDTLVIITDPESTFYDEEDHCMHFQTDSLEGINTIETSFFQKKHRRKTPSSWHELGGRHVEFYNQILRQRSFYV